MRQIQLYSVKHGDTFSFNFPAAFVGVNRVEGVQTQAVVSVLIDTDELGKRTVKFHIPQAGLETEVRAEWYIGSDRGVSVFAERLK